MADGGASDLVAMLAKGLRARQTFGSDNPAYQKILGFIRSSFQQYFRGADDLLVLVEEGGFRVDDELVSTGTGRESLAFLFYKDGIRRLEFFPGFEEEIDRFLELLQRARRAAGPEAEDLVTLLWGEGIESFRYEYVDLFEGEGDLPDFALIQPPLVPEGIVTLELASDPVAGEPITTEPLADAPSGILSAEDFRETLYFLDPAELEELKAELEREWSRDLRRDVLYALMDRLEDATPERQLRILEILGQLLPAFLSKGELTAAATLLRELGGILARPDQLTPEARLEAEILLSALDDPVALTQLCEALESGSIDPESSELAILFSHLGPAALPVLLRSAEGVQAEAVRDRLTLALERLGTNHPGEVVALLGAAEDDVVVGAIRLVGRLRLADAVTRLGELVRRGSEAVRLCAVEALIEIRSAPALRALQGSLEDPAREVRIAAARGFGAIHYQPVRQRLEKILGRRDLRGADLTEKLAFFEAYAAVAGADGVPFLERFLSGRGLLGHRHPPEVRACAATALGRIRSPAAQAVLGRARDETDPVVRGAVLRSLRQGAPAS